MTKGRRPLEVSPCPAPPSPAPRHHRLVVGNCCPPHPAWADFYAPSQGAGLTLLCHHPIDRSRFLGQCSSFPGRNERANRVATARELSELQRPAAAVESKRVWPDFSSNASDGSFGEAEGKRATHITRDPQKYLMSSHTCSYARSRIAFAGNGSGSVRRKLATLPVNATGRGERENKTSG